MGSVGVVGEDESLPVTNTIRKTCKSPRKLLDEAGVFNGALIPRKLRSAINKQLRESIISPLPISRKQRRLSSGVETLKKQSSKKSKLNMKRKHVTKDEEEVAETLFALADMFSGATKKNKPCLDAELSETKSSTGPEAGTSLIEAEDSGILTPQAESRNISLGAFPDDGCHSSDLVGSIGRVVKFQSCGVGQKSEFPFGKKDAFPSASALRSDIGLGFRQTPSKPEISNMEWETPQGQITASGIQRGNRYEPYDKNSGLFLSPTVSSSGAPSLDKLESDHRLPPWFGNTNRATQPREIRNSTTGTDKKPEAVKKLWKSSMAHVHICRVIKVLQSSSSEQKDRLLENSNQLASNGGLEMAGPHLNLINNQKRGTNGSDGIFSSNDGITLSAAEKNLSEVQNAVILHNRLLQDQHEAAKASVTPGLDFLSLVGGEHARNSNGEMIAGYGHDALKQMWLPFLQSQIHHPIVPSLPQNHYSSSLYNHTSAAAAQKGLINLQVQLPSFLSSLIGSGPSVFPYNVQQSETRRTERTSHLLTHCNPAGVAAVNLPNWQSKLSETPSSPSLLNCAQALFPNLQSALAAKYQQITPMQQQQLMVMNSSSLPLSSNLKRQNHCLPTQEKCFFAAQTGNM